MLHSLESLDRPSARVIGWDEDDDDTLELELNESAMRALNEAAEVALAAFEGRAEPHLTREAPVARQAFEQVALVARPAGEVVEQKSPPARQAGEAAEAESPAVRQGTVSVGRAPRRSRQFVLGLGVVAAAAGLLGGLAYLATARAPHPIPIVADSGSRPTVAPEALPPAPAPAPTSAPASARESALPPAPPATPAPSATSDAPVRFKNPFDRSEVFEFPAGTSQTEMRAAVAELLAQRARERHSLFVKRPPRNAKTADRNASVAASRAAPRS